MVSEQLTIRVIFSGIPGGTVLLTTITLGLVHVRAIKSVTSNREVRSRTGAGQFQMEFGLVLFELAGVFTAMKMRSAS